MGGSGELEGSSVILRKKLCVVGLGGELSLLGCIKGNCVSFMDNFLCVRGEENGNGSGSDGVFKGQDMCVFDLYNGELSRIFKAVLTAFGLGYGDKFDNEYYCSLQY